MRRAYGGDFLRTADGTFLGIGFGVGYCAEHEWGIDDIKSAFGVTDRDESSGKCLYGAASRRARRVPKDDLYSFSCQRNKRRVHVIEFSPNRRWYDDKYSNKPDNALFLGPGHGSRPDDELSTAWSDSDFGVMVSDEHRAELKELWEALQSGDVAFGVGDSQLSKDGGLWITLTSRIPTALDEGWVEQDKEHEALYKGFNASGIVASLRESKCEYFDLFPKRLTELPLEDTAYDFLCWLTPKDKSKYNTGWFTVEELRRWAEDEGPVVKEESKS